MLGLTTLETQRLRGGLIEVFKFLNDLIMLHIQIFFTLSDTRLRGHEYKLKNHVLI